MANSYPPGYTEPTEEETNFWADRAAEKQAFIDEAYQRGRTDALKNQDPDRYDKAWSDGYAEGKAHAIKELMEGEPDGFIEHPPGINPERYHGDISKSAFIPVHKKRPTKLVEWPCYPVKIIRLDAKVGSPKMEKV